MPIEENKAIIRRFIDALDRGNVAELRNHPGLHQTVQRHPIIRAAFPDLRITVEEQIAEGQMVATRATMRGTQLGAFMGAAPTGQQLAWSVLLMDQVVDDKIALHYANADWISVLMRLGVVPPYPVPAKP